MFIRETLLLLQEQLKVWVCLMEIQVIIKGHYKYSNLKAIVNATKVKPETIYGTSVYNAAPNF